MAITKTWIKTNWKNIALILLVLFGFSKCSQSCSRQQDVNRKAATIAVQDSIITSLSSQVHDLELDTLRLNQTVLSEKSHNSDFTTIASSNQQELYNKLNALTRENANLKKEIASLKEQVKGE